MQPGRYVFPTRAVIGWVIHSAAEMLKHLEHNTVLRT